MVREPARGMIWAPLIVAGSLVEAQRKMHEIFPEHEIVGGESLNHEEIHGSGNSHRLLIPGWQGPLGFDRRRTVAA